MSTSTVSASLTIATNVEVSDDTLTVHLSDGRTISAPLAWYPRLSHANLQERNAWKMIGKGQGIHWPAIDEDISVDNLLAGQASTESQQSFKAWLQNRSQ